MIWPTCGMEPHGDMLTMVDTVLALETRGERRRCWPWADGARATSHSPLLMSPLLAPLGLPTSQLVPEYSEMTTAWVTCSSLPWDQERESPGGHPREVQLGTLCSISFGP